MALHVMPGEIERFIRTFLRVNTKKASPIPNIMFHRRIRELIVAKGVLRLAAVDQKVDVDIPESDQVDKATYLSFTGLLANGLAELLQAPHMTFEITQALKDSGVSMQCVGHQVVLMALPAGTFQD